MRLRTIRFALSLVLCCGPLLAQSELATLTGVVTDPSGALVRGVEVVATHEGTTISAQTQPRRAP